MPRTPEWEFGMVLQSRATRVMFVRWDKARQRMMGSGAAWFVGIRLDNNDWTDPKFNRIGALNNYSGSSWKLVDDDS